MTTTALHSAATGMKAMDTKLDVIAHNIANSNTAGFKSSRVNFEDLFYEERRQPGALNSLGQRSSTGLFVGLGARVSNTQYDLRNGSMEETGQPLDLAIQGEGYFKVQSFEGIGGGEAYSRAGNLMTDVEGNLVLGTADGLIIDPPITFDEGTEKNSITITSDGTITAKVNGEDEEIGKLKLYRFRNPHGLAQVGGNLYVKTDASGEAEEGSPQDEGFGSLMQRFLEASNVDPVRELISMIRTQRSFEMNSKTIQAADENLQVISRLRR